MYGDIIFMEGTYATLCVALVTDVFILIYLSEFLIGESKIDNLNSISKIISNK